MSNNIALIIAAVIVGVGLALSSGIYTTIPIEASRGFLIVNKFTGSQCWYTDIWEASCPASVRVTTSSPGS
jgi:hypothetical protein